MPTALGKHISFSCLYSQLHETPATYHTLFSKTFTFRMPYLPEDTSRCYFRHIVNCWNNSSSDILIISPTRNDFRFIEDYKLEKDNVQFVPNCHLKGGKQALTFAIIHRHSAKKKREPSELSEASKLLRNWFIYLSCNRVVEPDLDEIWKVEANAMYDEQLGRKGKRGRVDSGRFNLSKH
jgi:hypothetical protein